MKKTALVTGASRGIGKEIARRLAAEGYDLYLICLRSTDRLEALAGELQADYGVTCRCFTGDVADPVFIRSVFTHISSLDVLINNAGISHIGLLTDMSDAQWDAVIGTNLSAAFYTCRESAKLMLQKHAGKIINISSVWGTAGASMEVAYSASKGGLNAFTRALAKELAPSGIQVNAIACGVIDTDMNRCFSQEELELLKAEIPADRIGQPEEVAAMVSHILASPAYLTGQIITLDGGWQ